MLEDRVELPRLYIAWHSPALFADGDAELDLVARSAVERQDVAAVSRARLRAAHRHRSRGVAELARARQLLPDRRDRRARAHAGRSRARDRQGDGRRSSSAARPRGELERCLAQAEAHFLFRLQTVGGFGGKSDQLNAYNTFLGDPGYFEQDLERYRSATTEQLRQAAATHWLKPTPRVVLSVVPRGRVALALAGSQPVAVS